MLSRVWRSAHLCFTLISCIFLLVATLTGFILALDSARKQSAVIGSVAHLDTFLVGNTISKLQNSFLEINEILVSNQDQIIVKGLDLNGTTVTRIVDPQNGQIIGTPTSNSPFIEQITSLHRSLMLHDAGRFIVGINAFLLFLIAVSGIGLLLYRQLGLSRIFGKIKSDFKAQWLHVFLSRILLLPILLIALSGTFLYLLRFELLPSFLKEKIETQQNASPTKAVNFFETTNFATIKKIEFPFDDASDEFFLIEMKDRLLEVEQGTGNVIKSELFPFTKIMEFWSLELHTGRSSIIWAIVLGVVALGILVLLVSGIIIALKRKKKVSNNVAPQNAEIVLLLGSESGSTRDYARLIMLQFGTIGKKVFLAPLNAIKHYPSAQHIIFITATYGDGDAPATASNYLHVLEKCQENKNVPYSVLGFGSKNYEQFCGFAFKLDEYLEELGYNRFLPVYTVNEKSVNDILSWVASWNQATGMALSNSPQHYEADLPKLHNFKVTNVYKWPGSTDTFILRLMPKRRLKIQSGDILNIYPQEDIERSYSIGMINGQIQLVVKLHENGIGSQFLYHLKRGDVLQARVISNTKFNLSKKYMHHIFIANGTGVAPFLGMMRADEAQNISFFAGFRQPSECNEFYTTICTEAQGTGALEDYFFAFSRIGEKQYVMDLIRKHSASIIEKMNEGACIYICGSMAMQKDVEACLAIIFADNSIDDLATLKERGQLKTDCY